MLPWREAADITVASGQVGSGYVYKCMSATSTDTSSSAEAEHSLKEVGSNWISRELQFFSLLPGTGPLPWPQQLCPYEPPYSMRRSMEVITVPMVIAYEYQYVYGSGVARGVQSFVIHGTERFHLKSPMSEHSTRIFSVSQGYGSFDRSGA
eukprot:scaffold210170_cov33-Prasinocladus_malaysianus.AAC.2